MRAILKFFQFVVVFIIISASINAWSSEKKIAVILSGCGVFDGSEISEAVLTMLAIDREGAKFECFAPDKEQMHVINHLTQKSEQDEKRNVLKEAARIARGNIEALDKLDINKIDAIILPGGFGAAKNLCDFAVKGPECTVDSLVAKVLKEAHAAGKPLGFICIAPVIAANLFGSDNVNITIGNDIATASALEKMGAKHISCQASQAVFDEKLKIITTPAFMSGKSMSEVADGIQELVKKTINACD